MSRYIIGETKMVVAQYARDNNKQRQSWEFQEIDDTKVLMLKSSEHFGPRLSHLCRIQRLEHYLRRPLCPYRIKVRRPHHRPILAIVIDEIDDAPFLQIFLAANNQTTKRPAISLQIRAKLMNMQKETLSILPRRHRWISPRGYRGYSPQRVGNYTPKAIQSATAANNYSLAYRGLYHRITHLLARPGHTQLEKLKTKDKQAVTFTPIHCSVDEVAPEMTQCDSSTDTATCGKSVTSAQTNLDSTDIVSASANEPLRDSAIRWFVHMSALDHDGPYDAASIFCKATNCVQDFVGTLSKSMPTLARLVRTWARPRLLNKDFLSLAWRKSINTIKLSCCVL